MKNKKVSREGYSSASIMLPAGLDDSKAICASDKSVIVSLYRPVLQWITRVSPSTSYGISEFI